MQADYPGDCLMMFAARFSIVPGALRALLAAVLFATVFSAHARGDDPALPGEVIVKLRTTAALDPLLGKYQLGIIAQFGKRPIYRLKLAEQANLKDTIAALRLETDVLLAERNIVHSSPEARTSGVWAVGTPADYVVQWAPAALGLATAQLRSTGAGMRVAVLDTGVDRQHPALAGRLLPGFDFVDYDDNPSEEGSQADVGFGHGTHVAGIVAMVAPDAMIMPLRVLDASGRGNTWVLAEALLYAVDPDGDPGTDDGAHIINLSLGTPSPTHILGTIAKLVTCEVADVNDDQDDEHSDPGYNGDRDRCGSSSGVVIVAAAGNDATDAVRQYPAAEGAYGLLAVGASNADSRRASFSNFGRWVDIAAPGEGITSAVPGGGYGTWSGTSMAAPFIAGTAALVRALNPGMTPDDVAARLVLCSSNLRGSKLRQVDAAAAVRDVSPNALTCR
jgi:subtilisin family serine protease